MSSDPSQAVETTPEEQRRRRMRRVAGALAPFSACMGIISFTSVANNPRFESIHTLDVIRLMSAGASFALALLLIIQLIAFSGSRSVDKKDQRAS